MNARANNPSKTIVIIHVLHVLSVFQCLTLSFSGDHSLSWLFIQRDRHTNTKTFQFNVCIYYRAVAVTHLNYVFFLFRFSFHCSCEHVWMSWCKRWHFVFYSALTFIWYKSKSVYSEKGNNDDKERSDVREYDAATTVVMVVVVLVVAATWRFSSDNQSTKSLRIKWNVLQ